ncbi:MAG: helix-turn-helix domain-containing protein [Verrucomicrobiales bacterium]|nr:helix-turn-helix domain-containing protein [Verrucomicrobiales bacterium]
MKDLELRLLTTRETAAFVGVCDRTIQTWVHDGIISHLKIGKLIRFNPMRVLQDLDAFEVPAKTGGPAEATAESPSEVRHVDELRDMVCSVPCCVHADRFDHGVEMNKAGDCKS